MQSINTHSIEDYLVNNSLFPIVCNFKSIYENFYESNGFLTVYAFDSLNNWTFASSSLIKSLYFRTFSLISTKCYDYTSVLGGSAHVFSRTISDAMTISKQNI